MGFLAKCFPTLLTFVRSLSRVTPLVLLQVKLLAEALSTFLALIGALTAVTPQPLFHNSLLHYCYEFRNHSYTMNANHYPLEVVGNNGHHIPLWKLMLGTFWHVG